MGQLGGEQHIKTPFQSLFFRKGAENEKSSMLVGNLIPGKKAGAVPKIPQLTKLDSAQKDEFMVQLPDGSLSVL